MANTKPSPSIEELTAQLEAANQRADQEAAARQAEADGRKAAEQKAAQEAAARQAAEQKAADVEQQAGQLIEELQKENQEKADKIETLAARKQAGLPTVKIDGKIYQITAAKFRTKKGDITAEQLAADETLCRELLAKGSHALEPIDGRDEDDK